MILLIGGASHTGKTALAQKMIETYHFACFSLDHLKMGLIRSGQTSLTPMDDDKLTDYLWPIVREWIKTAIENEQKNGHVCHRLSFESTAGCFTCSFLAVRIIL